MSKAVVVATFILVAAPAVFAQSCPQPSGSTLRTVAEAVSLRFDLAPDLMLEDQGTVNSSCYRRLSVRSREPRRTFFLYLSPDQRFVTPDLIDLTLSQLGERQRETTETVKLLEADRSPAIGPATSLVTIVEFADFQCPYCKQLAEYMSRARSAGLQFRVIFKQTPLPQHVWARQAAILSSCAAQQSNDAFWRVHDCLFEHQPNLSPSTVRNEVRTVLSETNGIDLAKFDNCTTFNRTTDVLQTDERLAQEFHIKETPTIFINGSRKVGLMSFEDFVSAIRASDQKSTATTLAEGTPITK